MVSHVFKSAYIKARLPSEGGSSSSTKPFVESDQSQNPAVPMVRPMKAALQFDDIKGFGEWPILLSTRAQKDLRDTKRADGTMFRIVMKKIK